MKVAYFVSYTFKRYGQEHTAFHQMVIAGRHPFDWLIDFQIYNVMTVTIISFQKITLKEWKKFPGEKWNGSKKISKEEDV